ncbi:MAG: MSMEG_0568 family radical SAM protein [bacterium]
MALRSVAAIKADLLSRGLRLPAQPPAGGPARVRGGGAGPAEGITLLLEDTPASVPVASRHVQHSPFRLEPDLGSPGRWSLFREEERLELRVSVLPEPGFYQGRTADGIDYRQIALLHGADCLASTVLQTCAYWGTVEGCRFCGIGLSLRRGQTVAVKQARHLAEVARAAREEGAAHVTLTSGTTRDRAQEVSLSLQAARAVRQSSGLPVHVQLMPPLSRARMEQLRDAGVATLGIHLESLDPRVLERVSPCKAALSAEAYVRAWKDAVAVFGRNQVSTFLLLGLGERAAGLREGCRRIAELGVYPYLVPFRPIPGTPLEDARPADVAAAREVYEEVAGVLDEYGLYWRDAEAGCVRCRGCSALPDYQDALFRGRREGAGADDAVLEVVRSGPSLEACFAIRREVFVREQGFFAQTDRDDLDESSVHILARRGDQGLGTVRITPVGGGLWLGSRLAVLPAHRGGLGGRLVRKAEEEVRRRGGERFVAYIQLPRVAFFRRCGWRCLEEVPDYHGKPHVLMEAPGAGGSAGCVRSDLACLSH